MAFYQKYRPKTFSQLIGEDHVKKTLLEAVKNEKLSHAYLLCGPRGTGKTTTARLLAKAFNCLTILADKKNGKSISGEPCNDCQSCQDISDGRAIDVIEIDAASHTKVDEIREIIEKAAFVPTQGNKKVYIIDEVHMLSGSSFNALLKTLEEPPAHAIFILATTEVHKLPATILSRTQRYDFRRVTLTDIVKNLKQIAKEENIIIDEQAIELIALSAEGGHRDAIGLLEQVASISQKITKADVLNILGIVQAEEVLGFLGAIFNKDPEEGLKIAHRLFESGANMLQFNKEVIECLRRLLLYKITNQVLFEDTEENIEAIKKLSQKPDQMTIVDAIEIFIKSGQLLKDVSYPILPIEMAIVESCAFDQNPESGIMNHGKATSGSKPQVSTAVISTPRGDSSRAEKSTEVKAEESAGEEILRGVYAELVECAQDDKKKVQDDRKKIEEKKVESVAEIQTPNSRSSLSEEAQASESMAKPPTSETRSVSVFQMTDDLWQRVIEEAKKENTTLAALLRDAKPLEVNGNKVRLGVRFPFHKDKISEPKNCAFLEQIFSSITGTKCVISCEISNSRQKKKTAGEEDLVKAAEEIFS